VALLQEVRIRGFRSILDLTLRPGAVCALVGAPQTGKSSFLAAVELLLDRRLAVTPQHVAREGRGELHVAATLDGGGEVRLEGAPPDIRRSGTPPSVLALPAPERGVGLVAEEPAGGAAAQTLGLVRAAIARRTADAGASAALPAAALAEGLEACCEAGVHGLVLLVEEPELFLSPQRQRYLYRVLRRFANAGNQVIYSTHAANLLSVGRLEEIAYLRRVGGLTRLHRPRAVADEDLRLLTEFDAARSELLLARAAVLVEGQTERLALPFAFAACGFDADREGIAIVECGGKANIVLFGGVCRAAGVPFVALHDRDTGADPLNGAIRQIAGAAHTFVLVPDFERAAHLHGHRHKPERAWRRFAHIGRDELPPTMVSAVERAVALARGR
jgi:hypothetical protein